MHPQYKRNYFTFLKSNLLFLLMLNNIQRNNLNAINSSFLNTLNMYRHAWTKTTCISYTKLFLQYILIHTYIRNQLRASTSYFHIAVSKILQAHAKRNPSFTNVYLPLIHFLTMFNQHYHINNYYQYKLLMCN